MMTCAQIALPSQSIYHYPFDPILYSSTMLIHSICSCSLPTSYIVARLHPEKLTPTSTMAFLWLRVHGGATDSTTEHATAQQPWVEPLSQLMHTNLTFINKTFFFPENQLQNITQKQHTQPLASIASFYPTQFFSFSSFVTVTLCRFYYIIMVGPVFLSLCLFPVPRLPPHSAQ